MTRSEALAALSNGQVIRSRSMLIRLGAQGFEIRFESTSWVPTAIELDHDEYTVVEPDAEGLIDVGS